MKTFQYALLISLFACLAGCELTTSDVDLTGNEWFLVSAQNLGNGNYYDLQDDDVYSVLFREDGIFSVTDLCNTGGGRYEIEGDLLILTDLGCTEMACLPSDPGFLLCSCMVSRYAFEIVDNTLVLTGPKSLDLTSTLYRQRHRLTFTPINRGR